ncbi:xylanase deacetylase [Paenibacillus darwinianus]|uniref:Xylanase deacetylase n=1 Tax=Paenibacillus darwinianus TaxID=1380763 RepID=A0A9W5S480_9BACL|nr:polysaccharide deacetylase family protein [Paenibacillus darwinianus]EXX91463.1 xylanase deacetylase [Paenibacillus darwinianus]EXX92260.1 xylanase deacetylase [Paenibacillus darwinianus]EXX92266.1 xylanase deacetylase [Paenibacillus darwinianus]
MRKTSMLLTAALALMLAAGCGSADRSASGSAAQENVAKPAPDSAAATDNRDQATKQSASTGAGGAGGGAIGDSGTKSTTQAPTEKPDPSNKADKAAEPKKNLYRMNKNYRFEPLAPGVADKVVLLTFDDGPKEKERLTNMLDTLDKHKAKAVFFVNGYRVMQNPDLLKLIAERGQTIGNHSWDHINLKNESKAKVRKQIGDVQTLVEELTGKKPRMFRAPFGSGGDVVKAAAADERLLYMTWSNGSLDWDKSAKNKPDAVIASVMKQLHPGANILMHELPWTADALDRLLTKLEAKGYGFIDPETIELPGTASAAAAQTKASGTDTKH